MHHLTTLKCGKTTLYDFSAPHAALSKTFPGSIGRIEITNRIVLFILFAAATALAFYGATKLFDMPMNFSAKVGGLLLGCSVPILLAGVAHLVMIRRKAADFGDPKDQILIALLAIASVTVVVAGVTANVEWQGVVAGVAFSAVVIKLIYDQRQRNAREGTIARMQPMTAITSDTASEMAKRVALFVFLMGAFIATLYAATKLFDGTFNMNPTGVVTGVALTLAAALTYLLVKRHESMVKAYEGITWRVSVRNSVNRLFIALVVISLIAAATTGGLGGFHQWKALLGGGLLTAIAIQLTTWSRQLSRCPPQRPDPRPSKTPPLFIPPSSPPHAFHGSAERAAVTPPPLDGDKTQDIDVDDNAGRRLSPGPYDETEARHDLTAIAAANGFTSHRDEN